MKCRTSKEFSARKKDVTTSLYSLLQKLFPPTRSRDSMLKSFSATIVEKAIKLRDQMTEEHGVYRCTLPYYGDLFNEGLHQLGNPSGESGGNITALHIPWFDSPHDFQSSESGTVCGDCCEGQGD